MLEDEIMARRSFWRRQRDRERTLTLQEFDLAVQILFNIENVQLRKVCVKVACFVVDSLKLELGELQSLAKLDFQNK